MNQPFLKPEYRQRLSYHVALLGGVALLTSAAIGVADHLTRADIAQRQLEDLQATLQQVVPAKYYDNDLVRDTVTVDDGGRPVVVYRARRGGRIQAVCYQVNAPGYGNTAMVIAVGVDRTGTLLGVRVISHNETPGLGDKIELSKSDWISEFHRPFAARSPAGEMGGEKGWWRVRSVHRRHHHAARRGEGGQGRSGILRRPSRLVAGRGRARTHRRPADS